MPAGQAAAVQPRIQIFRQAVSNRINHVGKQSPVIQNYSTVNFILNFNYYRFGCMSNNFS